jgi:hypothetical protein
MGAARSAVQAAGGGLRALAHHYPLYQELLRLFRELRRQEIEPTTITALPNVSEATTAAAAVYAAFRELAATYADSTTIRQLAAAALALPPFGSACHPERSEGSVLLRKSADPWLRSG